MHHIAARIQRGLVPAGRAGGRSRLVGSVLVALLAAPLATPAAASPPAQWSANTWGATTCSSSSCHNSPADMQFWSGTGSGYRLVGLTAANFQARLRGGNGLPGTVSYSSTMTALADDTSAAGSTARAALLQYILDARDGRVNVNGAANATTLDFGSVAVGNDQTFPITIVNERSRPIVFSASALANGFSIDSPTPASCNSGGANTVAAGSTCTLTARFTPTTPGGSRSSTLNLTFTAAAGDPALVARSVVFSGVSLAPSISLSTATLAFSARSNFDSAMQCVMVTNGGNSALSLTGLGLTQPSPAPVPAANEYALETTNLCATNTGLPVCAAGGSVAAGSSCQTVLRFTPKATGTRNGVLTVSHNAPGQAAQTVSLQGTAAATPLPLIDFNGQTAVAFGDRALGGAAGTQTLTIRNADNLATMLWSAPRIEIRDNANNAVSTEFTLATDGCNGTPLGPLGTCQVTLSFRPTGAEGGRAATLQVYSSNASNSPRSIPLSGNAVAVPNPNVSSPAAFADTVAGIESPDTRAVAIENPRSQQLDYTATLIGTDAADFVIKTNACAGHVATLATCNVVVAFQPRTTAALGTRNASLQLTFTGTNGDPAPSPAVRTAALSGRAIEPLGLSAQTLAFTAPLTTSTTASAVLTNRGATRITLSTLAFQGAFAADYALAAGGCQPASAIEPGANCNLTVRFTPAAGATGARGAQLVITHDVVGSPQTLTLDGTATPAPQGRIALNTQSLAFPSTQLGASAVLSVTVQNTGDATLNLSSFTLSGAASADYSRAGTCVTAPALAINATCTLSVTFQPGALGSRSASLAIQSDASNGPATVSLTGTGIPVPAPVVTLSTATLDFLTQTVGGLYPSRSITVTNTGTAALTSLAISVQGAGFANVSGTPCPASLDPNASCTVDVSFTPTTAGTRYDGTLLVASNASGSPHSVALTGQGTAATVPVLTWSPAPAGATVAFGDVAVGQVSTVQSVTLLNQGPGGAKFTLLNAIGVDGAVFSVTSTGCAPNAVLAQGASCTIDVVFAPASAGSKSAQIQVASSGSPPATLTLTGTGVGGPTADLALSMAAINFPLTRLGAQSQPVELTLSGTGAGTVRVTGMAASGPYVLLSKTCPAVPFTLVAGSDCTVTLAFKPAAAGGAAGKLSIATDLSPSVREVGLSGSGEPEADTSSGGCSIGGGADGPFDPTLWALLLAAAALLFGRARAARRRPTPQTRR